MAAEAADDARNAISRFFNNIGKSDATKQVIIGAVSGFATGFISAKAGKTVALSVGGGIIILQVANDQGIIKVNYNKVNRKIDKVADKVEEVLTGRSASWTDKVVNFTKRNTPAQHRPMGEAVDKAKSFISRYLGDVDKSDTTKQILIGAGSGWISGYLTMRVAKTTAFAVGGGIILLQLASERGFIKVNWSRLSKKLEKVVDRVESEISNQDRAWTDKVMDFFKNNTPFTSGFVGGFLIGTAT
ncbi:hypothetical protein YQE_02830, partial [Dendroctonus ponderosae]